MPLSKSCDNDEGTPVKHDPPEEDDDELSWKYSILMGYGCGLVLGLSMGYMVAKRGGWRIFVAKQAVNRAKNSLQGEPINMESSDATSSDWSLFTSSDEASFTAESARDSFTTVDHDTSNGDPILIELLIMNHKVMEIPAV
ncbi:hypothetical protein V6N12_031393 [Hibiscus sabdariffa]